MIGCFAGTCLLPAIAYDYSADLGEEGDLPIVSILTGGRNRGWGQDFS